MEIISGGAAAGEGLSSQNLRDFLRIKEEYHHSQSTSSNGGGGRHNLTLDDILREKRGPPPPPPPPAPAPDEQLQHVQSNRTLLDIIREDQTSGPGGGGVRSDGRRSWRHLRDKIRLRRRGGGSAWPSSVHIPASDVPLNNHHHHHRRPSARFYSGESTQPTGSTPMRRLMSEFDHHVVGEEEEEQERLGGDSVEAAEILESSSEQPVRMSLMALLAENDRQMGLEGSAYVLDEGQEEEEEDGDISGGGGGDAAAVAVVKGGEYNNCCVCMVRHKGAAFIPCGHTFCRLCSRELWVQRGNCPLCNNYILEILDIF